MSILRRILCVLLAFSMLGTVLPVSVHGQEGAAAERSVADCPAQIPDNTLNADEISATTYTITYDANGGTGAPASQTKTHGTALTLSATVPSNFPCTFLGWSLTSDASAAAYEPGDSFTRNANTTLYAVWYSGYFITSSVTDGTYRASVSFPKGYTYFSFKPSFSGKVRFESEGTYDSRIFLYDASGNQLASDDDSGPDRNFCLEYSFVSGKQYHLKMDMYGSATGGYFVHINRLYDVTYNANGGSGAPAAQTKVHGTALTLSSAVPTRSGYQFRGWATSSSATSASYQPGGSYTGNAKLTLYAVWSSQCSGGNHSYTYKVTKTPTASATGTLKGTCSGCSATTTVTLPKLNTTNYTVETISVKLCTAAGLERYTWKTTTYGRYSFEVPIPCDGHHFWDGICVFCGATDPYWKDMVASGTCGYTIWWVLSEEGTLYLWGYGAMDDAYSFQHHSWESYEEDIRQVVIQEGITSIGMYAFADCSNLTKAVIPGTVERIDTGAFNGCTSLREITIPAGVKQLGDAVFYCYPQSGLKTIYFEGNAPAFSDGGVFNKVTATAYYPSGNSTWTASVRQDYAGDITWKARTVQKVASGWSGNTQWTLTDDGVLRIYGSGNMKNYDYSGGQPWIGYKNQIRSVVVEKGVTAIGECAFKGLTKLENVTLPASGLTKIGEAAFYGCTALSAITIPEGIYTIWEYTFKNCTSLVDLRLPTTLIKIDQGAFENCTKLPYIGFPYDLEILGSWSFKGCTALEMAEMALTELTEVREGAFKNCSSFGWANFPDTMRKLGDSCFYGIGAWIFEIPASVTEVGPWCFARAYSLEELTFKGNAPKIGEGAFNKVTLTAYYPKNNSTWTSAVRKNYGGTVTWKTW